MGNPVPTPWWCRLPCLSAGLLFSACMPTAVLTAVPCPVGHSAAPFKNLVAESVELDTSRRKLFQSARLIDDEKAEAREPAHEDDIESIDTCTAPIVILVAASRRRSLPCNRRLVSRPKGLLSSSSQNFAFLPSCPRSAWKIILTTTFVAERMH